MKMKVGISAAIASFLLVFSGMLSGTTPGTSLNVQLVGQNTLFGRGMNADLRPFPVRRQSYRRLGHLWHR